MADVKFFDRLHDIFGYFIPNQKKKRVLEPYTMILLYKITWMYEIRSIRYLSFWNFKLNAFYYANSSQRLKYLPAEPFSAVSGHGHLRTKTKKRRENTDKSEEKPA